MGGCARDLDTFCVILFIFSYLSALSRSRRRYDRPRMLIKWHLCSNRSSSAVAITSSPASTSGQSLMALLVVIRVAPRWYR